MGQAGVHGGELSALDSNAGQGKVRSEERAVVRPAERAGCHVEVHDKLWSPGLLRKAWQVRTLSIRGRSLASHSHNAVVDTAAHGTSPSGKHVQKLLWNGTGLAVGEAMVALFDPCRSSDRASSSCLTLTWRTCVKWRSSWTGRMRVAGATLPPSTR